MNALELLRRRHAEVKDLLDRLRRGEAPVAEVDRVLTGLLALESEHLFPILEGIEELADRNERSFREHEEIEDVLAELERTPPGDAELPAIAEELEAVCAQHFEDEEREIYPVLESQLEAAVLDSLGERMDDGSAQSPEA
jgi:hypothetical protein